MWNYEAGYFVLYSCYRSFTKSSGSTESPCTLELKRDEAPGVEFQYIQRSEEVKIDESERDG